MGCDHVWREVSRKRKETYVDGGDLTYSKIIYTDIITERCSRCGATRKREEIAGSRTLGREDYGGKMGPH